MELSRFNGRVILGLASFNKDIGMSTKFLEIRDISGLNGFGIQPTDDIQGCYLTANAAQTFTAPTNYQNWVAIITYTPGASVFVDFTGATAAVPTATVSTITSSLNPSERGIKGGATFSVITADATNPFITVEYQIIQPYGN